MSGRAFILAFSLPLTLSLASLTAALICRAFRRRSAGFLHEMSRPALGARRRSAARAAYARCVSAAVWFQLAALAALVIAAAAAVAIALVFWLGGGA